MAPRRLDLRLLRFVIRSRPPRERRARPHLHQRRQAHLGESSTATRRAGRPERLPVRRLVRHVQRGPVERHQAPAAIPRPARRQVRHRPHAGPSSAPSRQRGGAGRRRSRHLRNGRLGIRPSGRAQVRLAAPAARARQRDRRAVPGGHRERGEGVGRPDRGRQRQPGLRRGRPALLFVSSYTHGFIVEVLGPETTGRSLRAASASRAAWPGCRRPRRGGGCFSPTDARCGSWIPRPARRSTWCPAASVGFLSGIAVGDGSLYLSSYAENRVYRIDR